MKDKVSSLRAVFVAVKNMILPTPLAELSLIRHPEMEGNGDLEFWSDMQYLYGLQREILDELADGAFLWELPLPVEGKTFWREWDWEIDEAAFLIDAWKIARIGEAA